MKRSDSFVPLLARRVGVIIAVFLVLFASVAVPTSAGPSQQKPLKGEFVASQVPLASYMQTSDCDLQVGGVAHFPFRASDEGLFEASIDDLTGDWDLWVIDEAGEYITGSFNSQSPIGEWPGEYLSVPMEKGDRITLIACNFDGEPEITVDWKFSFISYAELLGGSDLSESLDVNFVFLGYNRSQVDAGRFLGALPKSSQPIVRSRSWYGHHEGLGIRYRMDYDLTFAGETYEDRFFEFLKKTGASKPRTASQTKYNGQQSGVKEIKANFEIDAHAVEAWLGSHAPAGVDTTENTVFLVNWFGRKDFRHHVYSVKTGKDVDTGFDFGQLDSGKMIAWGGTPQDGPGPTRRVWFHDLSAGPDWRTQNWNVDEPPGYIIPPVWEYGPKGMRDADRLTGDLAKVARYVAIDLFFVPSPIYPISITPSRLPSKIDLDMNVYEGDRRVDASESLIKEKVIIREMERLQPLHDFTADKQDRDFFETQQLECYGPHVAAWSAWPLFAAPSCYEDLPYGAYSNLFLYNAMNLDETLDDKGADYEATGGLYMVSDYNAAPPYLGLADDNHRDGTQSFIYLAFTPADAAYFGMTGVAVHEYGHHFGMSHMHDGYDSEDQTEFGPYGKKLFVWVGDEVSSIMSYLFVTNGFSQFERDNMARYLTAAYADGSRDLAKKIVQVADNDVSSLLDVAEGHLEDARTAFASHRYDAAAASAKEAYEWMVWAAGRAGVKVPVDRSGTTPEGVPAEQKSFDRHIKGYFSEPRHQLPAPWLERN